ncbi:prohibitin protein Wph [Capsaspora owczarzaki ATCC 30864]|uniref:Prohibitin n=1 Tax=Capsaspora owczarzaki (strain ATCC 30864) TaxID=595528 RepID=A0A0D2WRQ9_CAPO3|nr:prohibitin protein Wph [Capsaspora owczarzaki ATCC 30864]KJE93993.1 prohibitin protein Wph [Capsaspora owczarzaki ATCC 30864]|eukprot:XP_004347446.2 prohibitin protein Wph [Capsaspora owczarzaki ATCC 30864]
MAAALVDKIMKLGLGLAIAGGVAQTALFNVEGGHRAVILDQFAGIKPDVFGEGTHFKVPYVQKPIFFDVRSQPRSIPTVTGSKDLQNVNITLRILYRPRIDQLPHIVKTLGPTYDEVVLPSIANEVLKSVVAQFDAGELITQRETVSARVREHLTSRAGEFNILLDDISITHLAFGKEFTAAVEMKQVAQQDAERARFVVELAEQNKLASIIRAEGDSKAAELGCHPLCKSPAPVSSSCARLTLPRKLAPPSRARVTWYTFPAATALS